MKKLFYALVLIGLVGCGTKETLLPDTIKVYQIYEYDNNYGTEEQLPFGGSRGKVKQIVKHIGNGGTETYTFHRNGLIDEISTDVFDPTSKQNKIDRIKYIYKYEDDVLYRTIQKNGSKIHEDKTYYRNGLPMLRESNAGTEKWNFDNEGRLISYIRNDDILLEKKYMLNSAYEGKWIEEYRYMDTPYKKYITHYNHQNQITGIELFTFDQFDDSDDPWMWIYTEEYSYNSDGSYSNDHASYDRFGNLKGDGYCSIQYEYDVNSNWIKKISDTWQTEEHTEEYREIIYWEDSIHEVVAEEEIIPITNTKPAEDIINTESPELVIEEEIIPITSTDPVEEVISEEEAIPVQLVEVKPSFQDGDMYQFSEWVNQRLVYPEIARKNGIQGRVTLQFTVEKDGSVTNVKVLRGVDPSLDKEAVRIVAQSPKWSPGKQKDREVPVIYTFPVIFTL